MFARLTCLTLALFATACAGVDVQRDDLLKQAAAVDTTLSATNLALEAGEKAFARTPVSRSVGGGAVMGAVGALALAGGIAWIVSEGGDVDGHAAGETDASVHRSNVDE